MEVWVLASVGNTISRMPVSIKVDARPVAVWSTYVIRRNPIGVGYKWSEPYSPWRIRAMRAEVVVVVVEEEEKKEEEEE